MYKVGDMVKCIDEYDDNWNIRNRIGKVIGHERSEEYGLRMIVQFRANIQGHDGQGKGIDRHCWNIPTYLLRPRFMLPKKDDQIQIKKHKYTVLEVDFDNCKINVEPKKNITFSAAKGFTLLARKNILTD